MNALDLTDDQELVYQCAHCPTSGPIEMFGWRAPSGSGKRYKQPWCRKCRKESGKLSAAKKRAAARVQ